MNVVGIVEIGASRVYIVKMIIIYPNKDKRRAPDNKLRAV
jgi:hypothetical protein